MKKRSFSSCSSTIEFLFKKFKDPAAAAKQEEDGQEEDQPLSNNDDDDGNMMMMNLLPDCLLEEILLRLPIKSVFTMASTARQYRSIVSDPKFAQRYRLFHRPLAAGLFFQPVYTNELPRFLSKTPPHGFSVVDETLSFVPQPDAIETSHIVLHGYPNPPHLHILHSAGGLLLCSRTKNYPKHYYVCNPVTKQWVALPEPPSKHFKTFGAVLLLEDDHDDKQDPISFRVLRFPGMKTRLDIQSFSSKTGKWTQLKLPHDPVEFTKQPPSLVFQGSVYWIYNRWSRVAIYNIAKHSLHSLRTPGACGAPILDGRRGVLRFARSNIDGIFYVWSFCNNRWEVDHARKMEKIIECNPGVVEQVKDHDRPGRLNLYPMAFHPLDPDIVLLQVSGGLIATYDLRTGLMEVACKYGCEDYMVESEGVIPYVHPSRVVRFPVVKKARRSS